MAETVRGVPESEGKGSSSKALIIVLVVVVVICCLLIACGGIGWWLWENGDELLDEYLNIAPLFFLS